MAQYELNIRDYWRIVRKRKKIIISITIALTFLTTVISIINRPKPIYEATASVKVEKTTSVAGLFLEVLTLSPGDTLATQTVMIRSFPVLQRVAKRLGLIPKDVSPDEIRSNPGYSRIIFRLQSMIKAEQEGNTNIINITVRSSDPDEAQKVANAVAEEFKAYNLFERNKQVIEARQFIEKQLKVVGERLKAAENRLKEFKEREGLVSLTDEQSRLVSRFSELEARRDEIEGKIKEIRAQLRMIEEKKAIPEEAFKGFVTGTETPLIVRLNAKLSDLLLKRENLLINYLPAHPKVREIDIQIANIRKEMRKELESKLQALEREKAILEDQLKSLEKEVALLPERAVELARLEREVRINEDLFSLLKSKYQEALIKESEKIEEVSIVRHALRPSRPKNPPKVGVNAFLGFLIGLVFGLISAFVWESLDTSIGTIEDVEAYLNLPVLGVTPHIDFEETRAELEKLYPGLDEETYRTYATLISHFLPKSIASESFRALRTNVEFLQKEKGVRAIAVTSSSIGEGKTTVVLNLAITIAQTGKRVLIVDGDLRNHAIHHYFGIEREPGLTDAILGHIKWQDAVKNITDIMLGRLRVEDLLATPGMDNVSVMTSGKTLINPSEFLNSSTVDTIIDEMKRFYDYVLFDTPPVLPVADAVILASKVDGVLLIYQVGRVARSALKRSKLVLDNVSAKVLGVVLNGLKAEVSPDFYHMSYYYYRKEGKEKKKGPSILQRFASKR